MSHTYQSHLTVVIGNPNKEMQTVISQEAKKQGGMEEDVWFDYIREQFEAGTTPIPPHYMSHIDFMLSTMLGDDVRVVDVVFEDGLLSVSLEKILPEHQRRTVYNIGGDKELLLE